MGKANITNLLYELEQLSKADILHTYLYSGTDILVTTPSIIGNAAPYLGIYAEAGEQDITAIEDFIEIPAGKILIIDTTDVTETVPAVVTTFNAFYSSASEAGVISAFSYTAGTESRITVPSNARYFRMSFLRHWITPAQLIKVYLV